MWTTFWPDLLVALTSAVFGSVLTVSIAAGTYFYQRRQLEIGSVRALVEDIHHRRALVVGSPRAIPDAVSRPDYQQASLSVLDIRDRVRESRSLLRPQSKLQVELSTMIRACNRYLERSSRDPSGYWFDLEQLGLELEASVRSLASLDRAIDYKKPGGAAF